MTDIHVGQSCVVCTDIMHHNDVNFLIDSSTKFTFQLNLQNEFNKLLECHTQLTCLHADTCCKQYLGIGAVQADQLSIFLQVKFVQGN